MRIALHSNSKKPPFVLHPYPPAATWSSRTSTPSSRTAPLPARRCWSSCSGCWTWKGVSGPLSVFGASVGASGAAHTCVFTVPVERRIERYGGLPGDRMLQ